MTYSTGDRVRITSNDGSCHHYWTIGQTGVITGLGRDYMGRTLIHTVRRDSRLPGESDYDDTQSISTTDMEPLVEAPTGDVDEATALVIFKNDVRAKALLGRDRHGVEGVDDFLRSIGLDPAAPLPLPGPHTTERTFTVSLTVTAQVPNDAALPAFGRDLTNLMIATAGAESVTVGRVREA